MRVYGLSMVRNEADIIRVNVLYHLSAGFDRLLILDNGSTDGTREELRQLAKDPRVRWSSDEGGFSQGEVFTELSRQAHREGAGWILPVDADEFWHAPKGSIRSVLENTRASALKVQTSDFVQRREQLDSSPEGLLHMTRRVPEPVARDGAHPKLLDSDRISYIELARVPKFISRSSAALEMVKGAHTVGGVEGDSVGTDEIEILHAPLRSYSGLEAKALSVTRRGLEGSTTSGPGWHARRWSKLREQGRLQQEWAANSYSGGSLDVYGEPRPLVFDPTLRDAIAPFVREVQKRRKIPQPLWKSLLNRL